MNHGFLADEIQRDHWVHGQGKAGRKFGAASAMPGGHGWGKYKPVKELQNRNGFESMACTVFGSLNAWETLANFQGFDDFPKNCADRYNAILAGITPAGGSPHKTCESIRTNGVIPEDALPWTDQRDWDHFYFPNPMAEEFLALGRQITRKFALGHEWVWKGEEHDKPGKLKAMLERTTVCVSANAWHLENGLYVKRGPDNHWVMITDYRDGQWWEVFDHYDSVTKRLAWDTDFEQAKAYFLTRQEDVPGLFTRLQLQLVALLTQFVAGLRLQVSQKPQNAPVEPVPAVPRETVPEPLPASPTPMLETFCTAIRDFEGGPGDLNYRNNNPGNFRCSSAGYLPKYGDVKCVNNFARFPSYELGWEYLQASVLNWVRLHPSWTILDFFSHYAPPSDNNPTQAYALTVAKRCGVPMSTTLKELFA